MSTIAPPRREVPAVESFPREPISQSPTASAESAGKSVRWRDGVLSIFSKVVAVSVFVLIVAGALVTGKKAALSDATWPTFNGSLYPQAATFRGGLMFEDMHRLIASTVGFLMLGFTVCAVRRKSPALVKNLAWTAFALVVAQAVFGGLVIHSIRNVAISMTHATLAEVFFCSVITLVALCSVRGSREEFRGDALFRQRLFSRLTLWLPPLALVQIILGSGIRHLDRHSDTAFLTFLAMHFGVYLLIIFAIGGIFFLRWLSRETPGARAVRNQVNLLVALAFTQALLGVLSYFANRARQEDADPLLWHVVFSTLHLAVGAGVLATALLLTLRVHRTRFEKALTVGSKVTAHA